MSNYTFFLSNGVTEITVVDSAVNNTYSVPLLGQNTTAYGDDVALGVMRHLENFAAPDAPNANANIAGGTASALKGQLWFDSANSVLNVNVGTTATPNWKPLSSIAQGTAANNMLRYDATASSWVEEAQAKLTTGGSFRLYETGLTNFVAFNPGSPGAADFQIESNGLNNLYVDDFNTILLRDATELHITGGTGNAATIELSAPNNTDALINTSTVNRLSLGGSLFTVSIEGSLGLEERASAPADETGYGQIWVNSANNGLYYTNEAGTDVRIDVSAGGTVTATSGADNRIAVFTSATNIEGDATLTWDATTATMTLFNTGNTDSAAFQHDGTDFNTTFANTTDWNLSGLTTFRVTGNIDATGNVEGSSLDIVNTNTFQITNGAETTFDVNGASALNIRGMDQNDTGLNLEDGMSLAFEDQAQANPIVIQNTGVGGSAAQLEFTTTAVSPGVFFFDGIALRVYDSSNTDYGRFDHDGTDFNIRGVGATAINIIPTGTELGLEVIANSNTNLYANNIQSGGSWTISGDRTSRLYVVESDTSTQRPVGYNITPTRSTGSGTLILGREDVSYFLSKDGVGSAMTVQVPNDAAIPIGATFIVSNDGTTSGNITISQGASTSLEWMDGSGGAAVTGNRTLAVRGICTLRKASASGTHRWLIWGAGLS